MIEALKHSCTQAHPEYPSQVKLIGSSHYSLIPVSPPFQLPSYTPPSPPPSSLILIISPFLPFSSKSLLDTLHFAVYPHFPPPPKNVSFGQLHPHSSNTNTQTSKPVTVEINWSELREWARERQMMIMQMKRRLSMR